MKVLKNASYFLSGLFAASACVYVYCAVHEYQLVSEISLNLSIEILGILLTVWLIDAAIRSSETREADRIRRVAYGQLRLPLLHHVSLWLAVYKASLPTSRPSELPRTVRELFGEEFYETVRSLDFEKSAPVATPIAMIWADYLCCESTKLEDALSSVLEKYAFFLDPDTIYAIESLRSSGLVSFLKVAPAAIQLNRQEGIGRRHALFNSKESLMMREHVRRFCHLIDLANAHLIAGNRIDVHNQEWSERLAPGFGSGRV